MSENNRRSSNSKDANNKILINSTDKEEVRVAFVENGRLTDIDIESNLDITKKSNIYKAVISRIEPSLNAVFVDYGADKHGFLPFKEIDRTYFKEPLTKDNKNDIKSLLSEGQFLIIQVIKEERGNKGAAVSTFIRIPGCYLVLMPNNSRSGGISRQIEGEERKDLRQKVSELDLPKGMGVIVRTAGLGRTKEELNWDLSVLSNLWESINTVASQKNEPFLIFQESDVIFRSVRDHLKDDLTEIIVDTQEAYDQVMKHVAQLRPEFSDRIKLYSSDQSLFSRYRLECQIELAYKREVELLSGGSIVFDQGEALTAIDVNSKKATAGADIEETAFNTNLEAAEEIARQFKIRDLGGLIVIDFIDMSNLKNQRKLEKYLNDLLKRDRARTQCAKISRFGLLEMSRQRVRQSLTDSLQHVCPQCNGSGRIRSLEVFSLSMIRLLQEQLSKTKMLEIQLTLPVAVATYLLNEKRSEIEKLELVYSVRILIIPHPEFQIPNYEYKRKRNPGKSELSHQIQKNKQKGYSYSARSIADKQSPYVTRSSVSNQFDRSEINSSSNIVNTPKKTGVLRRLWGEFFGFSNSSDNINDGDKDKSDLKRSVRVKQPPARPNYSRGNNKIAESSSSSESHSNFKDNKNSKRPKSNIRNNKLDNKNTRQAEESKNQIKSNLEVDAGKQKDKGTDDKKNILNSSSSSSTDHIEQRTKKMASVRVSGVQQYEKPILENRIPKKPKIGKNVNLILDKYSQNSSDIKLRLVSTSPDKITAKLDSKIHKNIKESMLNKSFSLTEVKARFAQMDKIKLSFVETDVSVDKPIRVMLVNYKII